jgi:hypothetical protein
VPLNKLAKKKLSKKHARIAVFVVFLFVIGVSAYIYLMVRESNYDGPDFVYQACEAECSSLYLVEDGQLVEKTNEDFDFKRSVRYPAKLYRYNSFSRSSQVLTLEQANLLVQRVSQSDLYELIQREESSPFLSGFGGEAVFFVLDEQGNELKIGDLEGPSEYPWRYVEILYWLKD